MKIFLSTDIPNKAIVYYALQLVAFNKLVQFSYVKDRSHADLSVGIGNENTIQLSANFFALLEKKITAPIEHLQLNGRVMLPNGNTDYVSTIFYYVNCIQEYYCNEFDRYGRFEFLNSAQHLFGVEGNFVQQLIDEFFTATNGLNRLPIKQRPATAFLTHDIDFVYQAKNEDGMFALKNKRWFSIVRLLYNHYLGTPDWLNIPQIVSLEKQLGFTSNFFWLPIKNELNSDYDFSSSQIQEQLEIVSSYGGTNHLHKAIGTTTFKEEMSLFKQLPLANRFHFLKFTVADFAHMAQAGIRVDSSLGFANNFGFRNSYGLPFMPFDLSTNSVLNLVEVPMQIMDRTFFNLNYTTTQVEKIIADWILASNSNTVITINWHNNFFSNLTYAGYERIYRNTLQLLRHNGIRSVSVEDIIEEYGKQTYFQMPAELHS